jgi:hypothetical protein
VLTRRDEILGPYTTDIEFLVVQHTSLYFSAHSPNGLMEGTSLMWDDIDLGVRVVMVGSTAKERTIHERFYCAIQHPSEAHRRYHRTVADQEAALQERAH